MNEREVERQMRTAERMFKRCIAWKKDIYFCPFSEQDSPWACAHWWEMVSQHRKSELSKEVVAS